MPYVVNVDLTVGSEDPEEATAFVRAELAATPARSDLPWLAWSSMVKSLAPPDRDYQESRWMSMVDRTARERPLPQGGVTPVGCSVRAR